MARLELRVQGIVLVRGRILLARHAKAGHQYWVLPGGHREAGESLAAALARELDEEAGIRPTRISLFSVSEVLLDWREVIDIVFRVHTFEGRPRLGDAPPALPDRRLEALALHARPALARLEFRPAALAAEIASAWSRDAWKGARYLGELGAAARPGKGGALPGK
jgi:8-oxo-dGTP pyrophosphatase MutT (NUDIX family)